MPASVRFAAVLATVATTAALGAATASAQTPVPPDQVTTPGAPAPVGGRNDNNNSCSLHLKSQKRVSKDDDLTVDYTLRCATPINGYTLSVVTSATDEPVSAFETEIFAAKRTGEVLPDQSFSCFGDSPGWGVNCTGVYGGAYATIPGTFDLAVPQSNVRQIPGLTVTATVMRWLPVPDGKGGFKKNADGSPAITGAIAGPFKARYDDPKIKKAKPKKAKKATKKAAARR